MKTAIVDTDVVSMLFKGDTRAVAYRVHKLERWSLEREWGPKRKRELAEHVAHYTVLPVSRELCVKWAEVALQRSDGAADSNRRCLDSGQRALLSGTTHYKTIEATIRSSKV